MALATWLSTAACRLGTGLGWALQGLGSYRVEECWPRVEERVGEVVAGGEVSLSEARGGRCGGGLGMRGHSVGVRVLAPGSLPITTGLWLQ